MTGHDTLTRRSPAGRESGATRPRFLVEEIQRSLLPDRLPELPGLHFAGRYEPGLDPQRQAGDWYDAFVLSTGHVLLSVGDVVGAGPGAASAMRALRTSIQLYVSEGYTPRQVLERLNRRAFEDGRGDIATMLIAVLEPTSGRLVFASAGHPPAVVRHSHGDVELLAGVGGPPVGATPKAHFAEHETVLAAGAALVLYTDGLVERRGEDLDTGLERLQKAIHAGPCDAGPLADDLIASCDTIDRSDDVAVLVVTSDLNVAPLHLQVLAHPRVLRSMRLALSQWLARAGVSECDASDLLLAVNEAAANAIEHAYDPGDGDVQLEAERAGRFVTVRIRDTGTWRPARPVSGGLGMQLMQRLVDECIITPGPDGTTVELRADVDGIGEP